MKHTSGKIMVGILIALVSVIFLFTLCTSGRYIESTPVMPSVMTVVGPVLTYRWGDGVPESRDFIVFLPAFSERFGRFRIVTPFSDSYPYVSSELLYFDLFQHRIVLSSLAYDEGVVETIYS